MYSLIDPSSSVSILAAPEIWDWLALNFTISPATKVVILVACSIWAKAPPVVVPSSELYKVASVVSVKVAWKNASPKTKLSSSVIEATKYHSYPFDTLI